MKKPGKPKNEETRIHSLRTLNILDTQEEERFDRLARLAKHMFNVPIALVSLVDEERQWFKSCFGLEARETPRDISFCGHAILGDDLFIIPNAINDARFSDNPLVIDEPKIRFYAGCPLKNLDGSKLGTLCIIDTNSRKLTQEDLTPLQDLAEMVEQELAATQLATLDELTQISNRRGFNILAQQSLEICYRQNIPASLVFFDLNKFKSINDRFGHAEGDKVLTVFANQLRTSFRESDVFARIGGDEFVVLLTNTSSEYANEIVGRFHQDITDYNKKTNRGYDIAFSTGIVAVNHQEQLPIETLLDCADSEMYLNKQCTG